MRAFLLLLLMGPCLASAREIYRQVDRGDGVEFSDRATPRAEKITVTAPSTVPGGDAASLSSTRPAIPLSPLGLTYSSLKVTEPPDDGTLRDNTGLVSVSVEVLPFLQVEQGHRLLVTLDGQAATAPGVTAVFQLDNVDRGTHRLQAVVLDQSGRTLKSSPPVSFHLHRQFVVRPKPQPKK
jgi:hypothetical protein